MKAGIKHYGRGVENSVDAVIAAIEPSPESIGNKDEISFLTDPSDTTGCNSRPLVKSPVEILKRLNVPVRYPVISYNKTIEEWENEMDGIGSSVGWSIALPEFEGVIEPFMQPLLITCRP